MTLAQLQTLKADILADPVLNAFTNNEDGNSAIAVAYGVIVSSPAAFFVFRTDIPVGEIFDQILWARLTPADAPDGSLAWECRSMACQGKQFNLQLLLSGAQTQINAARSNVRAGLSDALQNVPSLTGGANQAAGWAGVQGILGRKANRLEKLFANVTGGNGSTVLLAATMVIEGAIGRQDVFDARNS